MNNVIIAENNTHPEDDINIAKEFNIILDSVADESSFTHDRYLRFAFANPKRMAELLELYARRKPSLREFLDTINISTLRGVPENFSSDKHAGSTDLVFEADLKTGGKAGLFVGIIAEHKSDIDDAELKCFSPMTLVALTSLKYIFNEEKFTVSFREAAAHLLKLDRSPEGRDFIKQSLSYFLWRWPNKHKDIKMDRPEIVAKRGYETFAEHYVNKGHADAIDIMREVGISHEQVAEVKKRLAALNK